MPFKKSEIRKILVISLTNIGDVVLTFPVIDILIRDFPSAELSVVVGPKAQLLLCGNPYLKNVYVFDKRQSVRRTLAWVWRLRRERFDLVVDLRNTAIPFFISARYGTSFWMPRRAYVHMKDKHLHRLRSVYDYGSSSAPRRCVFIPQEVQDKVGRLLGDTEGGYAVIAPGAADQSKRWTQKGFAEVCYTLIKKYHLNVIFVGDENDRHPAQRVTELICENAVNLCGTTTLLELASVLKGCVLTIVNDSAPMHLASYLDVPVVALFGPTDGRHYGPWGSRGRYLRENQSCAACQNPKEPGKHTCMEAIASNDVLGAFQITDNGVMFSNP